MTATPDLAGPGGAPGAVQVGLVVLGRVVVDDDVDVVDVDAPGGDVGGDQHRRACPSVKSAQRLLPHLLAQVAVDGGGLDALPAQLLGQAVGAALGAGEHERAVRRRWRSAAATFTLSISWTSRKRCAISSTVTVSELDLVEHGVVLVAVDEAVDGAVERGREQQRLVAALDVAQDPLDLRAGSPCRPCGRPRR